MNPGNRGTLLLAASPGDFVILCTQCQISCTIWIVSSMSVGVSAYSPFSFASILIILYYCAQNLYISTELTLFK